MLEIQEKFGTEGYEGLLAKHSNVVKLHITEAMDRGEAIGFIAYSYEGDHTVVYDMDDGGDLMLCDGLVRSVLFKSCLKGIGKAVFDMDESRLEKLRKLHFLLPGSNTAENIDSFMNGCEHCKSQKKENNG
ncbi:MAG: hypothetical protein IJK31_09710 [Ruminococcus sp.]|nr:hypothetical protein [Ruminococcus sp.]HRR76525.1 hypothetical protein [Ruminococcus sp.]